MRMWLRRSRTARLLWPVSLLFRLVVFLRRTAYRKGLFRTTKLTVPVVVVGNIFIGGTGKTPMTIWLADVLKRAGFTPGIVSRGYGSGNVLPKEVHEDSLAADSGDEPLLIRQSTGCPVVIGKKRTEAARHLLELYPEVDILISDDGLQHYALERDVEIIVFDGRGAGNGWMLPAGPLREPLSRQRDFTVVNSMNYPAPGNLIYSLELFHMQLKGNVAEKLNDRTQRMTLDALSEKAKREGLRVAAVAGIGNPMRFFSMLRMHRIAVAEFPLADHFDFRSAPFAGMDADLILVTEKDAVKCVQIKAVVEDPRIWVVPVRAELDGDLEQKIVEKCREYGFA